MPNMLEKVFPTPTYLCSILKYGYFSNTFLIETLQTISSPNSQRFFFKQKEKITSGKV